MGKFANSGEYNYDYWENLIIRICALITILFGIFGLQTWFFGFHDIPSFGRKFIPMDEESAILFLFTSAALAFIRKNEKSKLWHSYLTISSIIL